MIEEKLDFEDVLLVPNASALKSRSEVELSRWFNFSFRWSPKRINGIGIIAANMDTVGTISAAKVLNKHKIFTAIHKHYPLERYVEFFNSEDSERSFFTIGTGTKDFEKLVEVSNRVDRPLEMICIDIANGHSNIIIDALSRVRDTFPNAIIMAGNVVTPERTEELIKRGADIVKVGIGSGSNCLTRRQTGIGYPQLSAVIECAVAAIENGASICSDGGCTVPGDIIKAMVGGADFVMLGGMLGGTYESESKIVKHARVLSDSVRAVLFDDEEAFEFEGWYYENIDDLPERAWSRVPLEKPKVLMYGMSSETAMKKYNGEVASYRSSEGRTVYIPLRGHLEDVILDILGGMRSACTYLGAPTTSALRGCANFVKVRRQLNQVFER